MWVRTPILVIFVLCTAIFAHFSRAEIDATHLPPGGLTAGQTPQMVLLTFDDSLTPEMFDLVQTVLTNRVNPNGTPIQATFFVSTDAWVNDYYAIEQLHCAGHEIALHSLTHTTGLGTSLDDWRRELGSCLYALETLANIPRSDIRGFRAPFLQYNASSFQVLSELGLRYDASMVSYPGDGISLDRYDLVWPYTLHDGVQGVCETGFCPTENYPDLYSIPLWPLLDTNDMRVAQMDPHENAPMGLIDDYESVLKTWRHNFLYRYDGNRTPFGLWLHGSYPNQWLREAPWRIQALADFIDWAQNYAGVYFVTMNDCLDYMESPRSITNIERFPPFINTPRAPRPASMVQTRYYPDGVVVTASEPPPYRPKMDTLFQTWLDAPTDSFGETLLPPFGPGTFDGWFDVTNNTGEVVENFEIHFTLQEGMVTNFWGNNAQVDGNNYVLSPYSGGGSALPLEPGEVIRVAYRGMANSIDAIPYTENVEVVFRTVGPIMPQLQIAITPSGELLVSWNTCSYSYTLEGTASLDGNDFSPIQTLWNRNEVILSNPAAMDCLRVVIPDSAP